MPTLNLSFPQSSYSSTNKPSITTLKDDLTAIQTAVNALGNVNIAADAAIAYSKLNLAGSIVNADVAAAAAIAQSKLAAQLLAYAEVTADQTGISSIVDLTGLTVTFTAIASRYVLLMGYVRLTPTAGPVTVRSYIYEGSTQITQFEKIIAAGTYTDFYLPMAIITPSAGSHTYKLRASVNSGTISLGASATNACWMAAVQL